MKQAFRLLISLSFGLLLLPLTSILGANLLHNDGLEKPFIKYGDYIDPLNRTWNLQVAEGWEKFIIPEGTYKNGSRLRFVSSADWAAGNGSPIVEKRDGQDAQVWWSSQIFDAGLYQQLSGLTIGEVYGFQAGTLQVFETTTSKTDGKMFRSVGLDPTGGTSPTSTNVIWSPEENLDVRWFYPGIGAQALSTTMTVFVRVRSPNMASTPNSNQVWIDDTFMDIAPTTTLTLTMFNQNQITATWQGEPREGFQLFAYEAQYRPVFTPTWIDLQIFDSNSKPADIPKATQATFQVEPNVEYVVRARTWHEQKGGDEHEVPGPWAEAMISGQKKGLIAGNVLDNRAVGFDGAIVAVIGASQTLTTTTDSMGYYSLSTEFGLVELTATSAGWATSQPITVTVATTDTIPLTLTLRPPDNIIQNGDFEGTLDGWQQTLTQPTFITQQQRSGNYSLILSTTAMLTQSGMVTAMYQPTLSFWYQFMQGEGIFTAEILAMDSLSVTTETQALQTTEIITMGNIFSTTTPSDWQYVSLPLSLTEIYTGEVAVHFSLNSSALTPTVLYLDEVSLGSVWVDQRQRLYLPMVVK